MFRILLLIILVGCGPNRHFKKHVLPSESPCFDGTILNIDEHECELFYWGIKDETIKVRCAYSSEKNWWTETTFYALKYDAPAQQYLQWPVYCTDNYFRIVTIPSHIQMEDK